MIVSISSDASVALLEETNFKRFHVEVDAPKAALPTLQQRLGSTIDFTDAETAWVSIEFLGSLPAVAGNSDWRASLDQMIEKAKPHGWIDETRHAIRAHVVWQGEGASA